ncbi:MAG TPA: phenylalanine--tRNA ligase subunit beta, partial [Actinomycetes bacterium]|nr:phenylalanine--tRNA ligase subunit beta [Actinomycetes bacterium]
LTEAGPPAAGLATVEVTDTEGCPLYVARVVEGLDAARPAPLWMARRLFLYGQRPLGAVVDVTNYLLLDQGQPLHAFDLDLVPGQRIVVRRARDGERLRTLDGRDRVMDSGDTLITAGEEPLAIAGIIGGEATEVRPSTRRVLIESAHFPPAGVRRTMHRLGISTEGGQRWARGVDPAGAAAVCDQAAALMAGLAGGTVASGRLQAGPGVPPREAIQLDWRRSSRRLGAPEQASFAAEQLASVGCEVSVPDPGTVVAVPPTWRFDIEQWADLEEEVARRWGYEHIPMTLTGAATGQLTSEQRLRRRARDVLAGMGLTEVLTYPFLSQADLDRLELPGDDQRRRTLRVRNPLSEERPELRTTMVPGLAEVAARNLARGVAGVAAYEIGAVFLPQGVRGAQERGPVQARGGVAEPSVSPPVDRGEEGRLPAEPRMLGVVLAGRRQVGRFDDPSGPVDFADAKGIVEGLAGALGVAEVRYEPAGVMPFHPGRCASIRLGEVPIGVVGQLHPRVAAALDLPAASFAVELELTPLLEASPTTIPATTPSPYPELAFDVAFIVPPGATAQALQATLAEAAGGLLARLTLFDAYQGDPLPPGHRNLAYRVALQAPDRTLSDADAAGVRERMERLASQRLGAVLRGIEGGA